MVPDDDVGDVAKLPEVACGARHRIGPMGGGIHIARHRMGLRGRAGGSAIRHLADAIDLIAVRLSDKDQIMLLLRRQVSDDMQKLPGKVLMDKQIFHAMVLDEEMRRPDALRPKITLRGPCCQATPADRCKVRRAPATPRHAVVINMRATTGASTST